MTGVKKLTDHLNKQEQDNTNEYHTGSMQFASAESEAYSEESNKIKRMSPGPTGAASLRDRKIRINAEPRSVGSRARRSHEYDPDDRGLDDPRRPLKRLQRLCRGGVITQRTRASAIADLIKFTGRDKDKD
ncbi:unnamed protein product [Peronospora belbahrii]|uniref:Uncharacterized protein n=1 Tax=Peronospora belbahrii TaxID=622444 RepID=A0ABN8D0R6_9STRA|nr:unnamed protein product [Peronospora belbahrii]